MRAATLLSFCIPVLILSAASCDPVASTSYRYFPAEASTSRLKTLAAPVAKRLGLKEDSKGSGILSFHDDFTRNSHGPNLYLTIDTNESKISIMEAFTFRHTERKTTLEEALKQSFLRGGMTLQPK